MATTTIYLRPALQAALRARPDINVSRVCSDALAAAVGQPTAIHARRRGRRPVDRVTWEHYLEALDAGGVA